MRHLSEHSKKGFKKNLKESSKNSKIKNKNSINRFTIKDIDEILQYYPFLQFPNHKSVL